MVIFTASHILTKCRDGEEYEALADWEAASFVVQHIKPMTIEIDCYDLLKLGKISV
jgi:hypothetical protein